MKIDIKDMSYGDVIDMVDAFNKLRALRAGNYVHDLFDRMCQIIDSVPVKKLSDAPPSLAFRARHFELLNTLYRIWNLTENVHTKSDAALYYAIRDIRSLITQAKTNKPLSPELEVLAAVREWITSPIADEEPGGRLREAARRLIAQGK